MNSMQDRQENSDDGAKTPLWALVGAPIVMFTVSSGAFWGAYVWMTATNPTPYRGTAAVAMAKTPVAAPRATVSTPIGVIRKRPVAPRMMARLPTRSALAPAPTLAPAPYTAPMVNAAGPSAIPSEPIRSATPPTPMAQAPCPVRVTESRLAQGKAVLPPSGRRVAIVLHRSGSTAESDQETERQVIAVVANLAPADSFNVVTTAGQGSVFSPEPVSPQPQSVDALRNWIKGLPGGGTASLETGVSTALSMPAINKVVVVADVSPEREAETWRRLSDVVRTGNRFGAAVSAVTVTPRCTPAIAPAKGQGSGSEEAPSVARETIVTPGL